MLPMKKYYADQFMGRNDNCNARIVEDGFMIGAKVQCKEINSVNSPVVLAAIEEGLEFIIIAEPFIDYQGGESMVVYIPKWDEQRSVRVHNWEVVA